nr:hypothetical protein [Tanacetum cinerariifolium]
MVILNTVELLLLVILNTVRQDPLSDSYLAPYSCGEPYGKVLDKDNAANASYDDDYDDHYRHRCVVQCHPSPCPSCKAFAPPKMYPCTVKGHVNVLKDGLFSYNSKCGKTLGCGNYVCKETCHPGVCEDCELLPDMSSNISVRSAGNILNLESTIRKLEVDIEVMHGYNADTALKAFAIQKLPEPLQPDEANGKRTSLGQRKLGDHASVPMLQHRDISGVEEN